MKSKRLLALVGVLSLTLLLGACTISARPTAPVTQPELSTDWELRQEGRYVICENFNTSVRFSATAESPRDVVQVREIYVGQNTDEREIVTTPAHRLNFDANGRFTVRTTFGEFAAPLQVVPNEDALDSQAIVIVPVPDPENPPAESGVTLARFEVLVDTGFGATRTVRFPRTGFYEIPVWGGCERQ